MITKTLTKLKFGGLKNTRCEEKLTWYVLLSLQTKLIQQNILK